MGEWGNFCTVMQKVDFLGKKKTTPHFTCYLPLCIVFTLQANKTFPLESHSEIDT